MAVCIAPHALSKIGIVDEMGNHPGYLLCVGSRYKKSRFAVDERLR